MVCLFLSSTFGPCRFGLSSLLLPSSFLSHITLYVKIQLTRKLRWYTHLSTLLVASLAIIIQTWSRFPLTFSELFNHLKEKQPVSQCGSNPPLTVYCLESLPQFEANQVNRLSMASMPSPVWIASLVMVVLVTDMIVRDERFLRFVTAVLPKTLRQFGDKYFQRRGFTRTVMLTAYRVTWACLDLGLLVCVVLHLQDLRRLTDGTGLLSKPELWSYGQLISAMIWAPVLAKYAYYNVCECPISSAYAPHGCNVHQIGFELIIKWMDSRCQKRV